MSRLGELRFNQTTPLQFLHGLDIDVSLRCEMLTVVMSFALSPPLSFVDFRVRFSSAPTWKRHGKDFGGHMQDIVTLPLYRDGIMCVEVMLFVTAICHVVAPPGSCKAELCRAMV